MKWGLIGVLLLLAACAQAPEPVFAPPTTVQLAICDATQEIGEHCSQTCECLRPGQCINQICSLVGLQDGQPCVQNKQCISGYCTENGSCSRPDGPKASFDCQKTCRDRYTGDSEDCYTVCKYR